MIHNLKKALISADSRLLEIQNSVLSIVVGCWFIFSPDIYNLPTSTFQYIKFMPAWFWGIVYATLGIAHLLALFTGLRAIRKEILLIKSCSWAFLSFTVLSGYVYSILGLFALVFMLMGLFAFLKIQIFKSVENVENAN